MATADLLTRALEFVRAVNQPLPGPAVEPVVRVESGSRRVCDAAVQMIMSFEGLYQVKADGLVYAYHDVVGYPTIGYGHLLSRVKGEDLSKYPPITKDEAYALKLKDLDIIANGVSRCLKVPVTDNQFGALVSLAFNIGVGNLQASTLLRKLNRGDSLDEVAAEFVKWNKAGGKIYAGLTKRRIAERNLFLC